MIVLPKSKYKIKQLLPANNWIAYFANGDKYDIEPLITWALVEDKEGGQQIRGVFIYTAEMGGEWGFADDDKNFIGYENSEYPFLSKDKAELIARLDVIKEIKEEERLENEKMV